MLLSLPFIMHATRPSSKDQDSHLEEKMQSQRVSSTKAKGKATITTTTTTKAEAEAATTKKTLKLQNQAAREDVIQKIKKFQKKCSKATSSRRDMRAHNSMTAISVSGKSKYIDFAGPIPGVKVGDSFRYRAELTLLGLHMHLRFGVKCKPGDNNVPTMVTSVVAMQDIDKMESDDVLIYTGVGGARRSSSKKGEKIRFRDQTIRGGPNLALVNSITEKNQVRVIYGYKVENIRSGKKGTVYTYYGLFHVKSYEKEYVPGENGRLFLVYKFRLERIGPNEVVVPRMVCEMAGGSCSKDI